MDKVKWAVAIVGGTITAILGGWDIMLQVLVGFVVADYIVAIIAAVMNGELNSEVGFRGIAKKILLFVPVGVAYSLDRVLGYDILRNLAIWFYLANEGLSVLENLGQAGVPFPPGLLAALEQLKGKGEGHVTGEMGKDS